MYHCPLSIHISVSLYLYPYLHHLHQEVYFEEFAHSVTGASKSEIPRAGWQVRVLRLEVEFLL